MWMINLRYIYIHLLRSCAKNPNRAQVPVTSPLYVTFRYRLYLYILISVFFIKYSCTNISIDVVFTLSIRMNRHLNLISLPIIYCNTCHYNAGMEYIFQENMFDNTLRAEQNGRRLSDIFEYISITQNYYTWIQMSLNYVPMEFIANRSLCKAPPVNSPHKGQWRGGLMFSLIYTFNKQLINNHEAGDLRRHCSHYDVIVMTYT